MLNVNKIYVWNKMFILQIVRAPTWSNLSPWQPQTKHKNSITINFCTCAACLFGIVADLTKETRDYNRIVLYSRAFEKNANVFGVEH